MKKFYSIFLAGVMMAGMLITAGCDKKNQPENDSDYDIALSPAEMYLIQGDKASFELNVTGYKEYQAEWTSQNPAVATVDENGMVTAISKGAAMIICTVFADGDEFIKKAQVRVVDDVVLISASSLKLPTTSAKQLTASLKKAGTDITNQCTWKSDNSNVASVSEQGLVRGLKAGECVISASYDEQTITCKVTVYDGMTFSDMEMTVPVGDVFQLTTNRTGATFTSDNSTVASVTATGMLTAVAPGKAVITAVRDDETATLEVTVSNQMQIAIKEPYRVMPASIEALVIGDSMLLTTNSHSTITWTSSDPTIASIAEDGVLRGLSCGYCRITATNGKVSGSAQLWVAGGFSNTFGKDKYVYIYAPGNLYRNSLNSERIEMKIKQHLTEKFVLNGLTSLSDYSIHYSTYTFPKGFWEFLGYYDIFWNSMTVNNRSIPAIVEGVNGAILIPDNLVGKHNLKAATNDKYFSFVSNTLTSSQWLALEKQGAIFLPATSDNSGSYVMSNNNYLYFSQYSNLTAKYPGTGDACRPVHLARTIKL